MSDWSLRVVEDELTETWGAKVNVSDDPEVGIIVRVSPLNGHEDSDILLTSGDLRRLHECIEFVLAGRRDEQ